MSLNPLYIQEVLFATSMSEFKVGHKSSDYSRTRDHDSPKKFDKGRRTYPLSSLNTLSMTTIFAAIFECLIGTLAKLWY